MVDDRTPPTLSTSLESTARDLVVSGKGLLAADESLLTIGKRFKTLGIPNTPDLRRDYREALFTTADLGNYISGAILFDETIRQKSRSGLALTSGLERQGIIPGIKVDLGAVALPNFPEEKITQGLDGLRERLREYHALGARFTKWRAVIGIGPGRPTPACLQANAVKLALFAALSQEAEMVPIVEPEVLMDGDHTIDRCAEVSELTLRIVFEQLALYQVRREAMLLKPAMVLPGAQCPDQKSDDEIAARTRRVLLRTVPPEVPGIVFLSGGQKPAEATRRLAAIHRAGVGAWALTFSFGRALQEAALAAWKGNPENLSAAQSALLDAARQNSIAVHPDV